MAEQSYPRLLYRGPADETAETQPVPDAAAEQAALADGWRVRRPLAPPDAAPPEDADADDAEEDDDAPTPAAPARRRKR